jgi:hypothetical protein
MEDKSLNTLLSKPAQVNILSCYPARNAFVHLLQEALLAPRCGKYRGSGHENKKDEEDDGQKNQTDDF